MTSIDLYDELVQVSHKI